MPSFVGYYGSAPRYRVVVRDHRRVASTWDTFPTAAAALVTAAPLRRAGMNAHALDPEGRELDGDGFVSRLSTT